MSETRMQQNVTLVIEDTAHVYALRIELANDCHITMAYRKGHDEPEPYVMLWEDGWNAVGGIERFRDWVLTATGHRPPISAMRRPGRAAQSASIKT